MKLLVFFTASVLFVTGQSFASTVAVIDSGTDYKHKDLQGHIWSNSASSTTDADGTVYNEDLHGWNFAEKNNQIIDYKYLNTFSDDCYKIFEVQAKVLQGTATAEEKAWYTAKKKDATFLKELGKFGNFVHGTHVSGISTQDSGKNEVVAMKLIATEPPGAGKIIAQAAFILHQLQQLGVVEDANNPLAKILLGFLAKQQAKLLLTVGKYTAAVKSDVANGSFGVSVAAVKPVIANLLKSLLGDNPSDADLTEYAKHFVSEIVKEAKTFVDASPSTLFVFAAGNDGTNNDSMPVSPANIKTDNTIAVAATIGHKSIASFSNTGVKMVEVAAPGVAIESSIPGDKRIQMSGTSMAAPYVTNVAGMVKDKNRALPPKDIKRVIMETVDVKDFLSGKVVTGGIVNRNRAARAAELSTRSSLDEAIAQAKKEVADESEEMDQPVSEKDLVVLPLPNWMF